MSFIVTFNGEDYSLPSPGEKNWAAEVGDFFQALAEHCLTEDFTLTQEMNLGATYGLRATYVRSATASPASAGFARMARADLLKWRNQNDDADIALGVDSSNNLEWGGVDVALISSASPAIVTMGFVSSGNDTTTRYSCPGGPAAAAGTTELKFAMPCAGVIRNLRVNCASAPTGTCTLKVRKNGADSTVTCTVTSGNTTGSDTTHSVTVAAGDLVSVSHVMTSGNAPGATTVSFQVTPV